jgi:hypothetical protein
VFFNPGRGAAPTGTQDYFETGDARPIRTIRIAIYLQENKELSKKLIDLGTKPTISNIKNYMLKWLTVPLDEVPRLVRLIIMRSGSPERQ